MDLLTPPTDNLYKFLAIAGIAIITLTSIILSGDIQKLRDDSNQLSLDIAVLKAKVNFNAQEAEGEDKEIEWIKDNQATLERQRSKVKELTQKIQADVQAGLYDAKGVKASQEDQKTLKELETEIAQEFAENKKNLETSRQASDSIRKTFQTNQITLAELDAKSDAVNRLTRLIKIKTIEFALFNAFGAFIALWGFSLWYYKVQRLQDRMLAAELAAKLRETVPASSSTTPGETR